MSEFTGPGEEANEGFKMFNMGVTEFATAAALVSSIAENFERVYGKQQRQTKRQMEHDQKLHAGFTSAASEFKQSAKIAAQAAKEHRRAAQEFQDTVKRQEEEAKKPNGARASFVKSISDEMKQVASSMKDALSSTTGKFMDFMKKRRGVDSDTGRGFLSTKAGKLFDFLVGTVTDFAKKMLAYVAPIAVISKLLGYIWEAFKDRLDANRVARRDFGMQFGTRRMGEIRDEAALRFNGAPLSISAARAREISVMLNRELRDSTALTGDIVADIEMMEKGLGVDAAQSAEFFGRALRTTKVEAQDITDTFAVATNVFAELGLNVSETVSELAAMPQIAQQFNLATRQGQLELARQVGTAQLLGSTFGEAREFGDQFIDIGSAAEAAVNLRRWGLDISGRELTTRGLSDPAGLAADIAQGLAPTLNRGSAEERRFAATSILRSTPELRSMFADAEALMGAAAVVGDQEAFQKKIAEAMAQASQTPEEQLRDTLKEYTIATTNIGDAVDSAFKTLAQSIAKLISPDFLPSLIDNIVKLVGETAYLGYVLGNWNPFKTFSGLSRAEFELQKVTQEQNRRARAIDASREEALGRHENEFRREFLEGVRSGLFTDAAAGDFVVSRGEIAEYVTQRFKESGQDVESMDVRRAITQVVQEQAEQLSRLMQQNPREFVVKTANGNQVITMIADHKGTEGQGSSG